MGLLTLTVHIYEYNALLLKDYFGMSIQSIPLWPLEQSTSLIGLLALYPIASLCCGAAMIPS
jgi:hypothetical protein